MNSLPDPRAPELSRRTLLFTALGAAAAAGVLTVALVLPAEYGHDPLGTGALLGLVAAPPERTLKVADVSGGNERLREVKIPAAGEPIPLPNPAVHQDEAAAPLTREIRIAIPAEKGTEFKLVMDPAKMFLYSWHVDRGEVYADFHGHDPSVGDKQFVRYEEQQQASGRHGSLVAPFRGEHGWYWLNTNDHAVIVTLRVTGYWRDTHDYGIATAN
jgi:hypothetical protein